ncbi:MOSC N-terminal beta barrel domain-containing protein [Streptomyces chartreusis]|uniref:MOSC N-terminal beta barrel domain-containing protein n=1 Tax=Streptomyces chartreusis TaxID=1969 RepID=UPI0033A4C294
MIRRSTSMLGTIERIWRYPIKSTGGELLDEAAVDARGLVDDRLYAVRDAEGKFGSGKKTRRFRRMPGLLRLRSRYPGGVVPKGPELLAPDGVPVPDSTLYVRRYLGRNDVEVARQDTVSHFGQLPLSS